MILGTAQLGMRYGINNALGMPEKTESFEILDLAREADIFAVDTAGGYGESEMIIGEYLECHPNAFNVCTKLSADLSDSQDAVSEDLNERLDILKLNSIFCCYLHRFHQCQKDSIINGMLDAKSAGYIEKIGISIYHPEELAFISDNLKQVVDIVQLPLNVLSFPKWESAMDAAVENDITLYARSVYLQGLLLMNPMDEKPRALGATSFLSALHHRALEKNISTAEYCFGFVESLPQIEEVIVGCESKEQLLANLEYLDEGSLHLTSERKVSREQFSNVPDRILNPSQWNE